MGDRVTYSRLGDYIREVNVRNRDLAVTELLGININKYFMPSVANVIGTDMSNYKIVVQNQFACNLMHVGRDEKIPIAMLREGEKIIVSPAYFVFEVTDREKLIPEYLMMWFLRSEFDRNGWFYTDADVRGGIIKRDFFEMTLPIPSIEKQQEIVAEYEALSRKIAINEQLCDKLEQTTQALYRKMFVDDIDPENLPDGWRMGTIGEFCKEMKSGGTPSRSNNTYWDSNDFRWLKTGEVHNNIIFDTEEYISKGGLKNSSAKLIPQDSVIMAMYGATAAQIGYLACETTTNQACCNMICKTKDDAAFLFFHLIFNQEEIKRMANGGAQENLSQDLISNLPIFIFDDYEIKECFSKIINLLRLYQEEKIKVSNLQLLLLSKLATN